MPGTETLPMLSLFHPEQAPESPEGALWQKKGCLPGFPQAVVTGQLSNPKALSASLPAADCLLSGCFRRPAALYRYQKVAALELRALAWVSVLLLWIPAPAWVSGSGSDSV